MGNNWDKESHTQNTKSLRENPKPEEVEESGRCCVKEGRLQKWEFVEKGLAGNVGGGDGEVERSGSRRRGQVGQSLLRWRISCRRATAGFLAIFFSLSPSGVSLTCRV